MNGSSASVLLDFYSIADLGWFVDARQFLDDGSRGDVLASSHIHADRADALREVLAALAAAEIALAPM
jgi:hypothetical protein